MSIRADAAPRSSAAFWAGVRAGAPFILVVGPFGMLFGVVATEAGFDLVQTMAMTFLVIAGASQFAATGLLADHAPALIAVLTGLAVNMRMALYSASLAPHLRGAGLGLRAVMAYFLVDQTYALTIARVAERPDEPMANKVAYFMGSVAPICPLWYVCTYVGAVAGEAIPPQYSLDFAVPITFLALLAPMLRGLPNLAAALVSGVAALALAWLPLNFGLIAAALAGMATGAGCELWLERRR